MTTPQIWQEITPDGLKFRRPFLKIEDKGYFEFSNESGFLRLLELNGEHLNDITPDGTWRECKLLWEQNGQGVFLFRNHLDEALYGDQGNGTLSSPLPNQTCKNISFLWEQGGKGYFTVTDSANTAHLYELDNGTWRKVSPNTPAPIANWIYVINFLGENGSKGYFHFTDGKNPHLYELENGSWQSINPDGSWENVDLLARQDNKLFFRWSRFAEFDNSYHLYEFDSGSWRNITPNGSYAKIVFLGQIGGKPIFWFHDQSTNAYLYEVDNGTVTDITATDSWKSLAELIALGGNQYFLFEPKEPILCKQENGQLSSLNSQGNISGSSNNTLYLGEQGGKGYFCHGPMNPQVDLRVDLYELDNNSWLKITPETLLGNVSYIARFENQHKFLFVDKSQTQHLFEIINDGLQRISTTGTWNWIWKSRQNYYDCYLRHDDGANHHLYRSQNGQLHDITPPAGMWGQTIDFVGEKEGKAHFRVQNGANWYLYEFENDIWQDITYPGTWSHIGFARNLSYFYFIDDAYSVTLCERQNEAWQDITPPESWNDCGIVAQDGDKKMFSFSKARTTHLHERSNNSWQVNALPPLYGSIIKLKTKWSATFCVGNHQKLYLLKSATPTVELSLEQASFSEKAGMAAVVVTLSHLLATDVTVHLTIGDTGSTATDSDYSHYSGSDVTIEAGKKDVVKGIWSKDDLEFEGNETVVVSIASITGDAEMGDVTSVTATIIDDDTPVNIVNNPGFENDDTGWTFESPNGDAIWEVTSLDADEGLYSATITFNKNSSARTLLYQSDIALELGKKYELTFSAKASDSRKLSLRLTKNTNDTIIYSDSNWADINVATIWQPFTIPFTASRFTGPTTKDGRLYFILRPGVWLAGDQLYIDNVIIQKVP